MQLPSVDDFEEEEDGDQVFHLDRIENQQQHQVNEGIEYIIKLAGIDFVAVGSDYDGLDCLPKEMSDCLDHFIIYEKLESRGYTTYEIEKVMGLNLIRVLEANKK